MTRWLRSRWPEIVLGVYWLALLTGTHWPKLRGPDIPGGDKTEHVLAYAGLAGLILYVASRRFARYGSMAIALGTVVLIAVAGAMDERTQPYFGRTCDFFDWLGDMAGASVVSFMYVLIILCHTPVRPRRGQRYSPSD